MRELFIEFLKVLIQILVLVIGTYVVKIMQTYQVKLEQKINKDNLENLKEIAKQVVYAIEQQYPQLKGYEKYVKAVEYIQKMIGDEYLTEEELRIIIEAAVKEMNIIFKPPSPKPAE